MASTSGRLLPSNMQSHSPFCSIPHWWFYLRPRSSQVCCNLFSLFRQRIQAKFSVTIPAILHIAFPAFRILLLIPLFFALHYPRVEFAPVENAEEREPQPTASTFLITPQPIRASAGLNSLSTKYGTISDRSLAPSSNPSTRAPTPVPQPAGPSKKKQKDEVTYNPSWSEFQQRLKNITPYLWPSRSKSLQAIAVSTLIFCI